MRFSILCAFLMFLTLLDARTADARLKKTPDPRPLISAHSYVTPRGIQIHEDCFGFLNLSRNDAVEAINHWVEDTFYSVTVDCAGKYPELSAYIDEWKNQFKTTVVMCTSKTSLETGYRGVVYPAPILLGRTTQSGFSKKARKDLRKNLKPRSLYCFGDV